MTISFAATPVVPASVDSVVVAKLIPVPNAIPHAGIGMFVPAPAVLPGIAKVRTGVSVPT